MPEPAELEAPAGEAPVAGGRVNAFRRLYGGHPAHVLLLLASFAFAGYAVVRWLQAPTPVRLLVWFAAAVIGHDLVAFPVYTAIDRLLSRVILGADPASASAASLRWRRAALNHIRIPSMLSALLFVMWYPLILRRSQNVYFAASGTHQNHYLGNWLLAVAILFAGSLLIFLARLVRAKGRSQNDASLPQS